MSGVGEGARPDARAEALYQEMILEHFRRPRNRGALTHADRAAERRNPLCGDAIAVELALDGDMIREAGFTGEGCSITQAAASMLTGAMRGLSLDEAGALLRDYVAMIAGDERVASGETLGELRALASVARFPARVRCAMLPAEALWEAMGDGEP